MLSNALKHGKGDVLLSLSVQAANESINKDAISKEAISKDNITANTALNSEATEADAEEGSVVHLEVTDDGPGFPPDFDPVIAANTGLELVDSIGRYDLRGAILY